MDKDSLNVDVYGTIDEAISALGVAYAQTESPDIREYINHIQKRMFQAGAEFASDEKGLEMLKDKIGEADIKYLEDIVDQSTEVNGLMREFVVPGVNPSSAALHVARTVVRRAERKITTLAREIPVRDELRKYINRLSDACFAMARLEEARAQQQEIEELEKRSNNVFQMKEGTLYPILHTLERDGAVKSYEKEAPTGRTRKYYHVTKKGLRLLDEKKEEWTEFSKTVNAILAGTAPALA